MPNHFFKLKRNLLAICLLLTSVSYAFEYHMQYWGTNNGLPNTFIYDIEQDQYGFLWIATGEGLIRFDGNTFEQFPEYDSLTTSFVTEIAISDDHQIWFGHYSGELISYDGDEFKKWRTKKGKIVSIVFDQENWPILIRQRGYERVQESGKTKASRLSDWLGTIESACYFDDRLWMATRGGLYSMSINEQPISSNYIPLTVPLTAVFHLSNQLLISGNEEGVLQMHSINNDQAVLTDILVLSRDATVRSFVAIDSLSFWANTTEGVFRCRLEQDSLVILQRINRSNGLPSNYIQSGCLDVENNLWLGTYGAGLVGIPADQFRFFAAPEANINAIASYEESLYIGHESGISTLPLNYSTTALVPNDGIKSSISSLLNHEGSLYAIANETELWRLRDNSWQRLNFDQVYMNGIFSDGGKYIWITTYSNGAYLYDPVSERIIEHLSTSNGLLNNEILQVVVDQEGNRWFGSHGSGLVKKSAQGYQYFVAKEGLTNQDVNYLFIDKWQTIWVGTDGGGLFYLENDHFYQLDRQKGLLSDFCRSIIDDKDGNLWIGSQQGITVIDPKSKSILRKHLLDEPKWQVEKYRAARVGQQLFWGTSEGLLAFTSSNQQRQLSTPLQLYSTIRDTLPFNNDTLLPYDAYDLIFSFQQISLGQAEGVEYQYFLEGFDEKWSEMTAERKVRYRKIEEGDYKFMVKSFLDGKLVREAAVQFGVRTPLWKTPKFYIILFVYVSLMVYFLFRFRTQQLRRRAMRLEAIVEERTQEIQHKNRRLEQFAKAIAHDLKNPVLNIKGLAGLMQEHPASKEEEMGDMVGLLDESITQLDKNIHGLIELTRIRGQELSTEEIDLEQLMDGIKTSLRTLIQENEAIIDANFDELSNITYHQAYLKSMIYNLVSNAIKYRSVHRSPEVKVRSGIIEEKRFISIADNGRGIDLKNSETKLFTMFRRLHDDVEGTGIGLHLVKEMIESTGGRIAVESEVEVGTTFTLWFD